MKHDHRYIRPAALLCALLVLIAGSAGAGEIETFTFRDGITWDTTLEQLIAAEGTEYYEDVLDSGGVESQTYLFEGAVDGKEAEIGYIYRKNQLVCAAYYYDIKQSVGYEEQLETLTGRYGKPAEADVENLIGLVNMLQQGTAAADMVQNFNLWTLADGTEIYLIDMSGSVAVFIFNASVLRSE